MQLSFCYVIKGTYFYSAQWMKELGHLQSGVMLELQKEPSNIHDHNAIQIWLASPRALLGYMPRPAAKKWRFLTQVQLQHTQSVLIVPFNTSDLILCKTELNLSNLNYRTRIQLLWQWFWHQFNPTRLKTRYNKSFKNNKTK